MVKPKNLSFASTFSDPVLFVAFGLYCCDKAGKYSGVADHSGIVWDEIVAMLMILLIVPQTSSSFIASFFLFRFFGILKPWPIRFFDKKAKKWIWSHV